MRSTAAFLLVLGVAACLACAGSAWKRALSEDSAAAYHRFLREYPDSDRAAEARARLDFVRVRSKPSVEGYEAFVEAHPGSPLVAALRPYVEESFFERARARGTADAYRSFLERFPGGELAARARGNLAFLESRGFGADPEALARFAEQHPESDFAREAARSASTVALRARTAMRRIGLELDIPAEAPSADRLRRVFAERARAILDTAGLSLVLLEGRGEARPRSVDAVLRIQHREETVRTTFEGTDVSTPGIRVTTDVALVRGDGAEPIWQRRFEHKVSLGGPPESESILFGAGAGSYWSEFFVPVARWASHAAVRPAHSLSRPVEAVEVQGARAVVLFRNGDVQIYDISDPEEPLRVGEYRHPRDLTRWSGLRIAGGHVLLFGPDGIELLAIRPQGPTRELHVGREHVGSVVAAEILGDTIVLAGNRGLLALPTGPDAVARVVLDREMRGLERIGERLLFTDGTSLFVSTLPLLGERRVEAELRLGAGFAPGRLRAHGNEVVVLGTGGVIRVDLRSPGRPRVVSRIGSAEVGEVRDAVMVRGRLFLLGQRGLMLADPSGERVIDSADVLARERLDAGGRHLVAVGDAALQVVDTTPFLATSGLAAPDPR